MFQVRSYRIVILVFYQQKLIQNVNPRLVPLDRSVTVSQDLCVS